MPNYIKATTKVSLPQKYEDNPKNHIHYMSQDSWKSIKKMIPLYNGSKHTEEHETYTRTVLKKFGLPRFFDEAGDYCYVENAKHNEDIKIATFDINIYFKDQAQCDSFFQSYEDNSDTTFRKIDFHKPYKDPT